jgi:hypothetical protein
MPAALVDRAGEMKRIEMLFAAVYWFLVGTFETCRRTLKMSAYWGRPESAGSHWPTVKTALLTHLRAWSCGAMTCTRDPFQPPSFFHYDAFS